MPTERKKIPHPSNRFPQQEGGGDKTLRRSRVSSQEIYLGGDDRRVRLAGGQIVDETAESVEVREKFKTPDWAINLGGDDRSANGFFAGEHVEIE